MAAPDRLAGCYHSPFVRSFLSRWTPALSMTLVSLISYVDRNTLALLAPTILQDIHLTDRQYGFAISAFSIAYMLGNPVWGRVLDRFGLRLGMTVAFAVWTLASVSHAFVWGFVALAAARTALGFGEGATFPAALRTVTQTLPVERRLRGIAVAYSGGSLGAVITPILITPIALRYGWRGAFWFTGFAGLAWLGWWLWMSRRAGNPPVAGAGDGGGRGARAAPSASAIPASGASPCSTPWAGAAGVRAVRRVAIPQPGARHGRSRRSAGRCGFRRWGGRSAISSGAGPSTASPRTAIRSAGMRRLQVLLLLLGLPLAATAQLAFHGAGACGDVPGDVRGGRPVDGGHGLRHADLLVAATTASWRDWAPARGRWRSRWRCRYSAACSTTIATRRRSCWQRRFRWRARWPGRR